MSAPRGRLALTDAGSWHASFGRAPVLNDQTPSRWRRVACTNHQRDPTRASEWIAPVEPGAGGSRRMLPLGLRIAIWPRLGVLAVSQTVPAGPGTIGVATVL